MNSFNIKLGMLKDAGADERASGVTLEIRSHGEGSVELVLVRARESRKPGQAAEESLGCIYVHNLSLALNGVFAMTGGHAR